MLLERDFKDGPMLHFVCAVIASFNAAIICNPIDVMKTRTMGLTDPTQR